jgi:DNA-directed RNA polymerase subunit RPC12/RpoP
MSIVKCKKCKETVATTESVKDKRNFTCKWCELKIDINSEVSEQ